MNFKRILGYVLTLLLAVSCKEEIPPIVITTDVTNISATTATSGGKIISEGTSAIQTRGVCWSTDPQPTINDDFTLDGEGVGEFSSSITGLTGATTFYVRAYASNSSGIGYGKSLEFSTLGAAPAATTKPASNVTATSATLNALVNSNYLLTTVTFEYGITTSYGSSVVSSNSPFTSSSGVNLTAMVSDLLPNQTYHFRVKSENSEGTVYGSDVTFQTLGGPPVVVAAATSSLSATTAVLYGTVNPNYFQTEVTFEYGTTTSYGFPPVVLQTPISGFTPKDVLTTVTGLSANTTYHFRIKAVNSLGTTYGNDVTFTTASSDFPTNGLVAYYTFAGGTALDLSGFENHAVISGAVSSQDRFNVANESFYFDSEDDMLLVTDPDFINNNTGSIVAWVKFNNLNYIQYVASVNNTDAANGYIGLLRLDNTTHTMGIYFRDPDALRIDWVRGSRALSANEYYHLVLTSDGESWNIYINGVKETLHIVQGNNSGKWFSSLSGLDNFVIGNSLRLKPYTPSNMFGKIDELLLYNRKLSDAEVVGLYYYSLDK